MSEATAGPFAEEAQRRRADQLGMYVFLASEVMLFGGLFAAISYDRIRHPGAAAEAARRLSLPLGSANTAVLLTSSLLVALAVVWARAGRRRATAAALAGAAALGVAFVVIKGFEYRLEYLHGLMPDVGPPSPLGDRPASLFIGLYFISTVAHAVHVTVGVVLLAGVAAWIARRRLALPMRATTVELVGLYWHLVDVIWIFLFPLLYLARP